MAANTDDNALIEGVTINTETCEYAEITWTKITNAHGAEVMKRPVGNYITIESDVVKSGNHEEIEELIEVVSSYLTRLINLKENDSVLIVGLGNNKVIADALGTRTAEMIFPSNHLIDYAREMNCTPLRPVSIIVPGVMGTTGINTREIIKGICTQIKPSLVIAIDALTAKKTERLHNTIQMTDTGISPGAGIGYSRGIIDADFLGTPIIAMGIPTTIKAVTLVRDTLTLALTAKTTESSDVNGNDLNAILEAITDDELTCCLQALLEPCSEDMYLTSKDIGIITEHSAFIIASAINRVLHPGIAEFLEIHSDMPASVKSNKKSFQVGD